MRAQRTLARPVTFQGVGVHQGKSCRVEVRPAPAGHGRVFRKQGVSIPATADRVVACQRCTVLGTASVQIATVEHLLSAAAGLALDNLDVRVEGDEIPILDGSAKPFFEALQDAGVIEQEDPAPVLELKQPVWVGQGEALVVALPADRASFEYHLYYDHPQLGHQQVKFEPGRDSFQEELAPARTFALWEEVAPLLEQGLARGGDLSNALVVYQDGYSSPLRLELEPVRHKCLDLLGDLALLGADLRARVVAIRAGHHLHAALAARLYQLRGDLKEDHNAERFADQGTDSTPISIPVVGRGDGARDG